MKPTHATFGFRHEEKDYLIDGTCKIVDLGQGPYLSCTYEEKHRHTRRVEAVGCLGREMLERCGVYDSMWTLVRWHLCNLDSGPMHYEANAVFWAERMTGCLAYPPAPYDRTDPVEAFKSTVIFGAVDGDAMPDLNPLSYDDCGDCDPVVVKSLKRAHVRKTVTDWCRARYSALMRMFETDLRAFELVE